MTSREIRATPHRSDTRAGSRSSVGAGRTPRKQRQQGHGGGVWTQVCVSLPASAGSAAGRRKCQVLEALVWTICRALWPPALCLQEVISHCKKLTRKNKEQLSDMMALDKQKGLKALSKEKRQKLEAYQHLFYLLQASRAHHPLGARG